MKAFVVFAASVLLAAPALAQSTNGGVQGGAGDYTAENVEGGDNAAATTPAPAAADERQICRRIESSTGTRMNFRRVCRTAEQWRAARREVFHLLQPAGGQPRARYSPQLYP